MPEYEFLIIGGGMTTDAAVNGIRQMNTSASIGIISEENHRPYNRPPLSKALWKGEPLEIVWRKTSYEQVDFHLSRTATRIDLKGKVVVDDRGASYSFGKLLFATGGRVRRLPYPVQGIIYFRTLDDYQNLRTLTQQGQRFAVIGGGFIGSEIAAALALNGKSVTMIFPEEGIGARVYPPALSRFLNGFYRSKGVEVLAQDSVAAIEQRGQTYRVTTAGGKELSVDGVVAGIGIQPNVELAQSAGVEVGNGIVVDEYLRTSIPDVYAAGDVANFHNPALEKRIRVEHEDNAITMGEVAGKNMAGDKTPYHHLPFFYSDLFELGYEAVGELDARLNIVEDWKEEFREGVVYYLENHRVRGVLLWNTWGQVDNARTLIARKDLPKGLGLREFLKGRIGG
ncbi:MAG TPA: FAD-dependent oxidoreductase [Bacteroidota bacterium]|nr:FAD-dependent oxidoreductase [Bacteroidota bacterium]